MFELGKKSEVAGAENLQEISYAAMQRDQKGRPVGMPYVPEGESLVCDYDQGSGERLFECESLEDVQRLYDAYARGGALRIHFYTVKVISAVKAMG